MTMYLNRVLGAAYLTYVYESYFFSKKKKFGA